MLTGDTKFLEKDSAIRVERSIVGFHQDERGDWVADLQCGHTRHVRHDPPWTIRPWVLTKEGRARFIGHKLNCAACEASSRSQASTCT